MKASSQSNPILLQRYLHHLQKFQWVSFDLSRQSCYRNLISQTAFALLFQFLRPNPLPYSPLPNHCLHCQNLRKTTPSYRQLPRRFHCVVTSTVFGPSSVHRFGLIFLSNWIRLFRASQACCSFLNRFHHFIFLFSDCVYLLEMWAEQQVSESNVGAFQSGCLHFAGFSRGRTGHYFTPSLSLAAI